MINEYKKVRSYLLENADEKGSGSDEQSIVELLKIWAPIPDDFLSYLKEFGWANIGPHELYGLGRGVEWHNNIINRAHDLWSGNDIYKIPSELLPFYDSGGGWFYCFSKMHPENIVVCWAQEYVDLDEPQPYDETYNSWSSWFQIHIVQ